jgi:hypothetical protein
VSTTEQSVAAAGKETAITAHDWYPRLRLLLGDALSDAETKACDPETPAEELRDLVATGDWRVYLALSRNATTPGDVLDFIVRAGLTAEVIKPVARHVNAQPDTLRWLMSGLLPFRRPRDEVIANPNTPWDMLVDYALDPSLRFLVGTSPRSWDLWQECQTTLTRRDPKQAPWIESMWRKAPDDLDRMAASGLDADRIVAASCSTLGAERFDRLLDDTDLAVDYRRIACNLGASVNAVHAALEPLGEAGRHLVLGHPAVLAVSWSWVPVGQFTCRENPHGLPDLDEAAVDIVLGLAPTFDGTLHELVAVARDTALLHA